MNAQEYDKAAVLEQEVGRRLLERLDFIKINPSVLLDLGGGTGTCTHALQTKYPKAIVLNLDSSEDMLQYANTPTPLCADMMSIPLKNHSVDLIFSNCVLQQCQYLNELFSELARVLKPEGLLLFTTFGPDTLKELRASLQNSSESLLDMHDIGDMLLQHDFFDPVMDAENIEIHYATLADLITDLEITASHQAIMRLNFPPIQLIEKDYAIYKRSTGELPATFEIVYGLAWNSSHSIMPNCNAEASKTIPIKIL